MLLLLLSPSVLAYSLTGHVVKITDGDTIKIQDFRNIQHKIRLSGIDCPELKQPFGTKAKRRLVSLIGNEHVTSDCLKVDKYGRHICKVFYYGDDINLQLVKEGMCYHFKKYQHEQSPEDRESYSEADKAAEKAKKGVWGDPEAVKPWDWRKR